MTPTEEAKHQQFVFNTNWNLWHDNEGTQRFKLILLQRVDDIEHQLMISRYDANEKFISSLLQEKRTLNKVLTLTESGQYDLAPRTV